MTRVLDERGYSIVVTGITLVFFEEVSHLTYISKVGSTLLWRANLVFKKMSFYIMSKSNIIK